MQAIGRPVPACDQPWFSPTPWKRFTATKVHIAKSTLVITILGAGSPRVTCVMTAPTIVNARPPAAADASRTLVTNFDIAVASPTYLARRGTPVTAADLHDHNCIIGYKGSNVPDHTWPLLDGGQTHVSGDLITNHEGLRLEAARRHLGIALVLDRVAEQLMQRCELVRVLPEIVGRHNHVRLVYPEREFVEPKVRAFVDFIAAKVSARQAA